MSDVGQVGGFELLHQLATKHRWKVGLFTDLDLSTPRCRRELERSGKSYAHLAVLEVVYRDDRYVRRGLGPGDENLDTAAFEILNSLRLLGVLSLQGPS